MIIKDLSKEFHPVPKILQKNNSAEKSVEMKKKSKKLAKLEKERTSILQEDNTKCFLCGKQGKLDKHEAFGGRNRQRSMKYKLVYYLCRLCHSKADTDKETKEKLQNNARKVFIKEHSKKEFIEIFK